MIKLLKLTIILLALTVFDANADTGLKILNWKENIDLNKTGKFEQITISAVANLAGNQQISAFSITFDLNEKIKITEVKVDKQSADFTFFQNVLRINFKTPKVNNQLVEISFSYEKTYDKVDKFLREEEIYVPEFAANANAEVIVNVPDFLESVTFNPNVTKIANTFTYRNVVPKNGVREIIKLTPSSAVWDVELKIKITSDQELGNIAMTLPQYFKDPLQKVENYMVAPSLVPTKQALRRDGIMLDFTVPSREMNISSKARIFTGEKYRSTLTRKPLDYLKYSAEERLLLTPILEKIKQDPKYKNFPLYVKIGKYVHDFIKYDESYAGKLPDVKEILRNPVGVCTEYSKLYSALAHVAGIPTATLYGGACGTDEKCEGHSWNLVYYGNDWIQVDPTWDLMSGKVSSSHVYLVENNLQGIEVSYEYLEGSRPQNIKSNFEFIMKSIK